MKDKIDFVILWVDNNDKDWQNEREKYSKLEKDTDIDNRIIRYRDLEMLKYWFRGVEKYAPWVNKIHFVTCGHFPKWLNTANPKLHIVKHSDYMPKDALPTFNSNAIELPIYKIEGLEEKFVLFNDDMFIIKKVKETDFFKKGLPCNPIALLPVIPFPNDNFYKVISSNMEIVNKHINYKKSLKKNLFKYLSLKQGKYLFKTFPFIIYNKFVGFANYHLTISYLKSTFEEVWNKEEEKLNQTVYSKFRNNTTNNSHWLFNYWQFAKGNFIPISYKIGKSVYMDQEEVLTIIEKQKYKILSLLEVPNLNDFNKVKTEILSSFEKILPEKSSFEL